MKRLIPILLALVAVAGLARAEWRAGAGTSFLIDDEDTLFGLLVEGGGYYPTGSIDSFFGAQLLLSGNDEETSNTTTETNYLALMALYRGYFPLGSSGIFRIYGEGGLGLGRSAVEHSTRRGNIDSDEVGLALQLGFGVEVGLGERFALRGGYDVVGLPENSGDFGEIGGFFSSFTLGLVFRF